MTLIYGGAGEATLAESIGGWPEMAETFRKAAVVRDTKKSTRVVEQG